MLLYEILAYTTHGKIFKKFTKIIYLKYQLQRQKINFNYPMDHLSYHIFKIILSTSSHENKKALSPFYHKKYF